MRDYWRWDRGLKIIKRFKKVRKEKSWKKRLRSRNKINWDSRLTEVSKWLWNKNGKLKWIEVKRRMSCNKNCYCLKIRRHHWRLIWRKNTKIIQKPIMIFNFITLIISKLFFYRNLKVLLIKVKIMIKNLLWLIEFSNA